MAKENFQEFIGCEAFMGLWELHALSQLKLEAFIGCLSQTATLWYVVNGSFFIRFVKIL